MDRRVGQEIRHPRAHRTFSKSMPSCMEGDRMIGLKTIRCGKRVAVWSPSGDVRFVDGPKRLLLFPGTPESVKPFGSGQARVTGRNRLRGRSLDGARERLLVAWLNR